MLVYTPMMNCPWALMSMHERARCSGGVSAAEFAPEDGQRDIAATNKLSRHLSTSPLLTSSTSSLVPLQRFNRSLRRRVSSFFLRLLAEFFQ
jgi:hypothetical protein